MFSNGDEYMNDKIITLEELDKMIIKLAAKLKENKNNE